jgi:pyruvate dehydrogenase E1 component alpha subunit
MSAAELERRAALADPVARLERMLEIRVAEDQIKELFATGLVAGSTHTCQGQEAVSVGIAAALRPTDVVCCTYRGHGHALALGMRPESVIGEILGREIGCVGGIGGSMHLSDRNIGLMPTMAIVGAGIPIAAGAAWAAQIAGSDDIAVAIFGDGAANIGAFHEALNIAALWKLPVLFICENNLYGEYSRMDTTTSVEDIAVRATAYGMPGQVVDGQDVDAVMEAVRAAADRARAGEGPTLLEMKTYRYAGHSRSDPATYRPDGELDLWLQRDPIEILAGRLVDAGTLDAERVTALRSAADAAVRAAVDRAAESPEPALGVLHEHVTAASTSAGR